MELVRLDELTYKGHYFIVLEQSLEMNRDMRSYDTQDMEFEWTEVWEDYHTSETENMQWVAVDADNAEEYIFVCDLEGNVLHGYDIDYNKEFDEEED